MRRFIPWIVAVVLFWPLVTIFFLGYRWSGKVVEILSPPTVSAIQSPAPLLPVAAPLVPLQPLPQPDSRQPHFQSVEQTDDEDDALAQDYAAAVRRGRIPDDQ